MKLKILKFFMAIMATSALVLTSCSDDDNDGPVEPVATCDDGEKNGDETGVDCGGSCSNVCNDLSGSIDEDTTLDASVAYTITGSVLVSEGVTLTIPAGTVITSEKSPDNYLAVLQGGSIDIQGTSDNPVIMQSDGSAGAWGGLLLCGNAVTTEGVNASAEVGGLVYGGSDSSDSSGNIDYLIIKDSGAQIDANSQFNGLTLYAVGSGTTIDNVAVINGTDDGIEFFGGSATVTNFYAENLADDAVDWTEGWNGTLTNAYISNTISNFSTVIEADGANNNPTLENFTAISSTGGLAIQIKNDSGATINGLTLTGFNDTFDFRDNAPTSNLQIDGADADTAEDAVYASSSTNASSFAWVTNAQVQSSGVLPANITSDLTLDASVEYSVSGPVLVNSGTTLTIPAGTTIVSDSGTANYIAVLQGAMIDIQGTDTAPVEMRSVDGNPWGGLLICGNATTTEGINAIAEVGGLVYGGSNDTESSGNIDYLILRDTGAEINADSQFNGLTLYAVGSGTTIDNVAVIGGQDDGIEFFGGTVDVTNFYAENLEDDSVDWTEGWNGTLTNTYVVHTIADFSTAIEADGANNNPTLVNFTAVSSTGGKAIQIKNNSGATINGLTLTGYSTYLDFRDGAPASNLQVDGADVDTAADAVYASSSTNASLFAWATGDSSSETGALPANITSDLTLDATVTYTVSGPVLVNSGATLTIPAGTSIVSDSGTANYIAVLQGAMIDIQGTDTAPVEMRSVDGNPWGGLLICGNATTTEGINAIAEVGGLVYGGSNDTESSGNIDYLILRDTGAEINADSQFNGLTLYAVGSGTTIDNVAVIGGQDDGIEFFGGTVDVTNFYAENLEDDSVDWTEGWNGTLTNTYVVHTIANFSTAIEADGANNNPTLVNFTAVSSTGGKAIQIKNNSGATINGLTLTGYSTYLDFRDGAPASNLQVDGADVDTAADAVYASSSTNASLFAWATGDSSSETGALPANITSDLTLDATVTYTVSGPVLVNSGATLTIPAGTSIVSDSGTANYIAVLQGAMIDIQGTDTAPVEMRSVDGNPWGGLLICGNATTTEGNNAIAEVGGLVYGGSNDTESSGNIDYLILRDTGAEINADSQFNGLTLYAVGSGTTIDNVAVIGGQDDGIEFFGGTVDVTNFYAENLEDDSVDWTEGWNGTLTNAYVNLTINNFSTAIEADGANNNPTLVNFTAVSTTGGKAIQIKNNSGCTINGLTLTGFTEQFDFRDGAPASNLQADGADANEATTYSTSTTVAGDFSWATN